MINLYPQVKQKVIVGQFSKRSEYSKINLNGLYSDHPPAFVISNPASVGVNENWGA